MQVKHKIGQTLNVLFTIRKAFTYHFLCLKVDYSQTEDYITYFTSNVSAISE